MQAAEGSIDAGSPAATPLMRRAAQRLRRLGAARGALHVFGLALGIASLASTQFFAQPFVWRHWEIGELLLGWLGYLGERALVALAIAAAVVRALGLFARRPALSAPARAGLYVLAVVAAVTAAEGLLVAVDSPGAAPGALHFGEQVLRWSGVTLAVTGLRLAWLRALQADQAADGLRRADLEAQAQLAALRLQTLQAQIEPHFLFNTLATVRRLGVTGPAQCAQLLAHLVDFIALSQAAQPGGRAWRVADELSLVRSYLGVVELRMEGRLRLRFEIDEQVTACDAPPLALATLVENAVKHGITPATAGGEIVVVASVADGRARLQVADTGVGLRSGGGNGIGLANTRARLRSLYGAAGQLRLAANQPRGVVATLEWPFAPQAAR
jgi:signal transduction histidine kinase